MLCVKAEIALSRGSYDNAVHLAPFVRAVNETATRAEFEPCRKVVRASAEFNLPAGLRSNLWIAVAMPRREKDSRCTT